MVDVLDLINKTLIKLDSLSLKIFSVLFFGIPSQFYFLRNGLDFRAEDHFVVFDEQKSLRYFDVVFVYFLDFDMDGVHLIDAFNDLLLLKFVLFVLINRCVLMISK